MLKLGLFGKNISHSRSQEMYEKLLGTKVDYHLLDYADASEIPPLKDFFSDGFKGLSVTYPYKQHFLDQVGFPSDEIKELGAINCIGSFDGKFLATNTDFLAAEHLLKKFTNEDLVVLGNGNMARIFLKLAEKSKKTIHHLRRSENGDLNGQDFQTLKQKNNLLVINCCSRDFIFKAKLPSGTIFWDMNYSFPEHSHLVSDSSLQYIEGTDLLLEQARFALQFWKINSL